VKTRRTVAASSKNGPKLGELAGDHWEHLVEGKEGREDTGPPSLLFAVKIVGTGTGLAGLGRWGEAAGRQRTTGECIGKRVGPL